MQAPKSPKCLLKVILCFCTAHNIATSKGVVIFNSCLKRGNYGPFCSPAGNAFTCSFDNSTWLKGDCLETCPSSVTQNNNLKLKLSLCCRFAMKQERFCNETRTLFIRVFCSLWLHKKYNYLKEKKNLDHSRRCIFLDMNDANVHI